MPELRLWNLLSVALLMMGHCSFGQNTPVVPGELLVEFRGEINPEATFEGYQKNGLQFEKLSPAFNIWRVKYGSILRSDEQWMTWLREFDFVENVQYNHIISKRSVIPNDTLFPQQWSLENPGTIPNSVPGADINASAAWDFATGGVTALGDTIVVAVIDGGFDLFHPDLDFWRNYNEIPNNNIDDDANGYIDDYEGWNAYIDSGRMEFDIHGTHVAGIAGARGNNGRGITGVCWHVKILPVAGASEEEADVVKAYGYVYSMRKLYNEAGGQKGAFIVASNSSFGVDFGKEVDFPIWCGLYEKMGQIGILNAVATANRSIDVDTKGDIPSSCTSKYTVVVTNTTFQDKRSGGAAYGRVSVDIGAPGSDIISTIPDSSYGMLSGTSMATPHVAGSIALLYSALCPSLAYTAHTRPGEAALYVKDLLLEWVRPLPGFDTLVSSGGRLDIGRSMQQLKKDNCAIPTKRAFDLTRVFPNPGKDIVTVRYTKYEETDADLVIYDLLGQIVVSTHTFAQPPGQYQIELNTHSLAPGMYMIYLRNSDVESNIMKLVIF